MAAKAWRLMRLENPCQPTSSFSLSNVNVLGCKTEGGGQPDVSLTKKAKTKQRMGRPNETTKAPGLSKLVYAYGMVIDWIAYGPQNSIGCASLTWGPEVAADCSALGFRSLSSLMAEFGVARGGRIQCCCNIDRDELLILVAKGSRDGGSCRVEVMS